MVLAADLRRHSDQSMNCHMLLCACLPLAVQWAALLRQLLIVGNIQDSTCLLDCTWSIYAHGGAVCLQPICQDKSCKTKQVVTALSSLGTGNCFFVTAAQHGTHECRKMLSAQCSCITDCTTDCSYSGCPHQQMADDCSAHQGGCQNRPTRHKHIRTRPLIQSQLGFRSQSATSKKEKPLSCPLYLSSPRLLCIVFRGSPCETKRC